MPPKMASRRRRNQSSPVRAPVTVEHWVVQLPDGGLCKAAVSARLQEARNNGEDCDTALAECFAWAAQEFPEEVALWCLSGAAGPHVWQNPHLQRSAHSALLALRELRSRNVELVFQRDALLSRDAFAAEPARFATEPAVFAAFTGTGHRLGGLSSLD